MKKEIIFLFFVTVLFFSCQSVPKNITYFQDLDRDGGRSVTEVNYVEYEPRIKNSDVLMITVSSPTLNQEEVAQFNLPTTSYLAPGEKVSVQSTTLQTYIVDNEGIVNYPVIGRVKVGGLTLSNAIDTITNRVAEYIEHPIVNMNILSFKVSVMGEVRNPGPIVVENSRISILDAIGAAGDLTIFGNRKNVKLIRDNNGKLETVYLDLTSSKDLFSSGYFYLQQNDVIYVDPNDTRKKDSKYGQSRAYSLSAIGSITGVVSFVASTILTIISITRK
ncbi:MAG: polysaccharide biosynthesis/export family protein [Dysgonamonadaceae bacterium]|jgi:polysaccharide export outer membrane protein|nr:polysaccharide biosynthesis/export family protein [Dysgonamonadaceae bacterium]